VPIVTLNAAIGMVLGWLFMRYGLVSAILAHFVADVVQGVIPRLVALIG
jgi:membrane protease YdiL (CAAX protease family)